jgi:predicted negative regulator of RcsB-dependent stress response
MVDNGEPEKFKTECNKLSVMNQKEVYAVACALKFAEATIRCHTQVLSKACRRKRAAYA